MTLFPKSGLLRRLSMAAIAAPMATSLMAFSAYAAPKVVATIKPVHSLAASIMEGRGEATLLVDKAQSPHDYHMRPSDAQALQDADLVIWIGEGLESFMPKALTSLTGKAVVLELLESDGLILLDNREPGVFGHKNDHDDHHGHHDDHDDHAHEKHDDHHDDDHKGHDREEHDDHALDDHHGHDHGEHDPHIWLSPENGKTMARAIAAALTKLDPEGAALYAKNLAVLQKEIDDVAHDIHEDLHDYEKQGFMAFHDAWQYFERHFHLNAVGMVALNPTVKPGAARIKALRAEIKHEDVHCLFAEPQYPSQILTVLAEGTGAKVGQLDPLGATLDDGPGLYTQLLRDMGANFAACMKEASDH